MEKLDGCSQQILDTRSPSTVICCCLQLWTVIKMIAWPSTTTTILYSQNHVKCSRPLCSLPGLQGQKIFADAIINFLIPFKSVSDKNSYDQLFINEVVKIFTFQFDESVFFEKFYLVKVFQILMKFWTTLSCAQIS